jgi:hypothetical protein
MVGRVERYSGVDWAGLPRSSCWVVLRSAGSFERYEFAGGEGLSTSSVAAPAAPLVTLVANWLQPNLPNNSVTAAEATMLPIFVQILLKMLLSSMIFDVLIRK